MKASGGTGTTASSGTTASGGTKDAKASADAKGAKDAKDAKSAKDVKGGKEAKGAKASAAPYPKGFFDQMRTALLEERMRLTMSADRLQAEADALMADVEPGDVQFDDESGEGDTLAVERERDLALSAQARETVADIDAALRRLDDGSYGKSLVSGQYIPMERLEAIPWATELVEEKVGGLGRR